VSGLAKTFRKPVTDGNLIQQDLTELIKIPIDPKDGLQYPLAQDVMR
jgi:hypothetical protein